MEIAIETSRRWAQDGIRGRWVWGFRIGDARGYAGAYASRADAIRAAYWTMATLCAGRGPIAEGY